MRALAASAGLSRPIATLVALLGSIGWAALTATPTGDPTTPTKIVNGVAVVVSLGLFCAAGTWWWQNRSFGLRPVGVGRQTMRRRTWVRAATTMGVVGLLAVVVATLRSG